MTQTRENIAALYCRNLAEALDSTASVLRDVGSREARQHAREAEGAAKMARQWARQLEKAHRAKMKEPAK